LLTEVHRQLTQEAVDMRDVATVGEFRIIVGVPQYQLDHPCEPLIGFTQASRCTNLNGHKLL
jgi:hypothetical protein